MPDIIANLIGQLLGGDSVATINPKYLDENGQPVAGQTPYKQPGFVTKLFFPDVASREADYNNSLANARLQNNNQNTVATDNAKLTRPVMGQVNLATNPNVSDTQYALLTGRDPSMSAAHTAESQSQDLAAGNPAARAKDTNANLTFDTRQKGAELASGLPESIATQNLVGSQLGTEQAKSGLRLLPFRENLELAENGARMQTLPSDTARTLAGNAAYMQTLPLETRMKMDEAQAASEDTERRLFNREKLDKIANLGADTGVHDATVANALADTKQGMLSTLTGTLKNELLQQAHSAATPAPDSAPYYRDPATGVLKPNPAFMNTMNMMTAKLKGGSEVGGMPTVALGNGLHIGPPAGGNVASEQQNVQPTIGNIQDFQKNFNTTPVSPVKQVEEQKQEQPIDVDRFRQIVGKKRLGPVAFDRLADELSKEIPLPEDMRTYVGSSSIRHSMNSVWKEILSGKNGKISQSDAFNLMKQLPPEVQNRIFTSAINAEKM